MPLNTMRPALSGKSARLKKWGDDDNGGDFEDEFGANEDFLAQLNESNNEVLSPMDEYPTIKLAPAVRGISPSAADIGKDIERDLGNGIEIGSGAVKKGFLRGGLDRFVEDDEERSEVSFGEDLQPETLQHRLGGFVQNEYDEFKFSPGAASSSPVRRRSLSDFSEDTDTDITDINDEDFEAIDDIFGKEESGIYSSGGTRASKKRENQGRASEILLSRRKQLEEQAQAEDAEYFQRYKKAHGVQNGGVFADPGADEVNTLKLKDLRLYSGSPARNRPEALENDVTINYEYTKDDFESFEDGFGDLPAGLNQDKLSQFHTGPVGKGDLLSRKASMPVFPRSLKASKPTKFRSSMDLVGSSRDGPSEHPLFNKNNKIIRKLDRMPSFHTKRVPEQRPPSSEDLLDYNMELRKTQLLEKYMEISEKQFQLRSSPRKKAHSSSQAQKPTKKGVGIVRYLNHKTSAPFVGANKSMRYNSDQKTWEGNDHDLLRFSEDKEDGVRSKSQKQPKPSLITLQSFQHQKEAAKGDMVFDADNLRWVNKNALAEQHEDVFEDLPDLVPNDIPSYPVKRSVSSRPVITDRGVSAFTQRTVSTNSNGSSVASSVSAGEEFVISSKLMARFEKEEAKIRKKTHQWFGPNETYHLSKRDVFDSEYFWEIRRMVMDNGA